MQCFKKGMLGVFATPLEVTAGVGVLASVLAFTAAMATLWQKIVSDRHTAWWLRAQWAIDQAFSDDPALRRVGSDAMEVLAADKRASPADLDVLDVALQAVLQRP